MVFLLNEDIVFPNPLLAEENGLLAIGGDLNVDRLLLAYSMGIFPWFNPEDEIMWWVSPYRPLYFPGQIKKSKSLRNTLRKFDFEVKIDTNFREVILNCATAKRNNDLGTWISEEIIESYGILFELGYLHTVEVYLNGRMVGGLYGVSLGKAFFGESMFHSIPNTSKVALLALSEMLNDWNFHFIDSQVSNPHSFRMGAKEVSRTAFDGMVKKAMSYDTKLGPWKYNFGDLRSLY